MPPPDLIIAVDCGSSSLRAVLFDAGGRVLRQSTHQVPERGDEIHAETDAGALAEASLAAVAELQAPAERVAAIGVTAALGLVLLDAASRPLTPVIGWRDRRAAEEARSIEAEVGAGALYAATGRRADPELAAAKLLWLRRHRPGVLAAAATVSTLKDWLLHTLCGACVTDPTSASYSLLFDVGGGDFRPDLLATVGIRPDWLPPVCAGTDVAGGLTAAASRRTGLLAGTPVVVGGPDGTVGSIGGGLVRPGLAVDVIGTTDVVFVHAGGAGASLLAGGSAAGRLVVNRFPVGASFCVGGPMLATGGAVAWFADLLGGDLSALTEAARRVPPGSEGLLISPVLTGSRAPDWNPSERGAVSGLALSHKRGHIFRAVLEGCAAHVADMFEELELAGFPVEDVRVVGGGTGNDLSLAIRAAALGRPLIVPEVVEASALGAAMMAAVGVGLCADLVEAERRMVRLDRRVESDPAWLAPSRDIRTRMRELRARTTGPGEGAGGPTETR